MKIEEISEAQYRAHHINSIKKEHPQLRQDSKAPSFALQYAGTWRTLVKNVGMTTEEAVNVEQKFKALYAASAEYTETRLQEASREGYVSLCFGLRLRTPILKKTLRGTADTPYEAEAEARTVGNALFQSTGLLNNRALNEFMSRVWKSPHALDIKPCAMIHDAIYLIVRDNIDVIEWVNNNLIECMQWQELPELQHETVKLGAELDVHFNDWSQPVTIPNRASKQEILAICRNAAMEYQKAA